MAVTCSNSKDIVKLLIASGSNINIKDKLGRTALTLARKNGYTNIVALLIASGAK